MLIHYWCPYLTNIATISSVKRSATFLNKFNNKNKLQVEIINSYGEWSHLLKKENHVIIKKPLTYINLFSLLPKTKFFSKLSLMLISFIAFIPLLIKLNREKPDYLIIHLLTALPLLLSPFLNKKTKIILRISGLPKLNLFRKNLWKFFSSKVYLITTPTEITKNDLIKKNIFNEQKIFLLRDPVIEVRNIHKMKSLSLEEKFLKKDSFYLSIGRLTNQKNFEFLIKEFSKISNKLKVYKLCIIGDGEKKEYLQKLIIQNKMENKILLLGYKNNPYKYLFNCKALISTSLYEDPGFAIVEAFYLNKPVISSNAENGPKEMSEIPEIGYFFEKNNSLDFERNLLLFEKNGSNHNILNAKKFSKYFTSFSHYISLSKLLNIR